MERDSTNRRSLAHRKKRMVSSDRSPLVSIRPYGKEYHTSESRREPSTGAAYVSRKEGRTGGAPATYPSPPKSNIHMAPSMAHTGYSGPSPQRKREHYCLAPHAEFTSGTEESCQHVHQIHRHNLTLSEDGATRSHNPRA